MSGRKAIPQTTTATITAWLVGEHSQTARAIQWVDTDLHLTTMIQEVGDPIENTTSRISIPCVLITTVRKEVEVLDNI